MILNIETGKMYVGSSISLTQRRLGHFRQLRRGSHYNSHLQNAYNASGVDAFLFTVLEYAEKGDLRDREQFWIDFYDAANRKVGYNIRPRSNEVVIPEESRVKLSCTLKLRGIKPPSFSRSHSLESRRKMSETWKVKSASENGARHIASLADYHRGRKRSAATKLKLSQAAKAREDRYRHEGPRTLRRAAS